MPRYPDPIKFPEPTTFETLGRNGYSAALGMELTSAGNCVMMEPINSRGVVGRARVCVHKDSIPALIKALRCYQKEE